MKLVTESRVLLLSRVSQFLTGQGIKSFLVGGTVRDTLLNRQTGDIDIAISADALDIARRMAIALNGKFILLDETNQIARIVVSEGQEASRTTFCLDISTLRGSIEQDLGLRDFTIDAIASELDADLADAFGGPNFGRLLQDRLIDPYGGLADLDNRIIKAVNPAVFNDDPLRLLRAVRLAAELSFKIDNITEELIQRDNRLITNVAGERIREELLKILAQPQSGYYITYLDKLGLLMQLMPELVPAKGTSQPKEHYWDVFDHSLQTVATLEFLLRQSNWEFADNKVLEAVPWSLGLKEHFDEEISPGSTRSSLIKLAGLLHDIAKPETKILTESGRTRFFGHDLKGASTAAEILGRLRFSTREIGYVAMLVKYHLRPGQMANEGLPTRRAIYRYFRDTQDDGIDILFLSMADHLAARGPTLDLTEWQRHARLTEFVLNSRNEEKIITPPKIIDGSDIINCFKLTPGPEIGRLLEAVREAQVEGEINNREEALAYINNIIERKQDK